ERLRRGDFVDQMQIDVEQRRCARLMGHNVVVPNLFNDGTGFHNASATASPTSVVVAGLPLGLRSAVTRPDASTLPTASFTAAASFTSPKLYSSMAATLPIAPSGLALFWPAMSGAEPCTGSYRPFFSPSEADGSMPIEPARMPPMSLRISPKVF